MSYTLDVKNEILSMNFSKAEILSEVSAILNVGITLEDNGFYLYTENIGLSRHIYSVLKSLFNADIKIDKDKINKLNKNYMIEIKIKDKNYQILKALSLVDNSSNRIFKPESYLIDSDEEKKAYLRGIFLICGSVNDPKTSRYHLEFVIQRETTANAVKEIINFFGFNSKVLKRDKHYMVYLKEAEKISDFIKLLNAYNSLFYFEDIRIYRDHKNMTNRINNCEQANIDKIVFSSNEQLQNITKLRKYYDFELLDEKIKELCIYKEKYPESSMKELADIISFETNKEITKSGINHRFRKIKEMVKKFD